MERDPKLLQECQRQFADQRWRALLAMAEEGRHVSEDHLRGLIEEYPIPDFARSYIAARGFGDLTLGHRSSKPPLSPSFPEWVADHFQVPSHANIPTWIEGREQRFPPKFLAVGQVWVRARRYAEFRSTRKPRSGNRHRLSESDGSWTVDAPKEEARRNVARRWNISASTLEDWEREARAWRRRNLPCDEPDA